MKCTPLGVLALGASALLIGCGGSGGGGGSTDSPAPAAPETKIIGSARFRVDLKNKTVSATPISDGRAAYTGNSISFTGTVQLSEGSPARKIVNAILKNETQEALGLEDGMYRVLFSEFQNTAIPPTSLQSKANTTTFLGNGTNSNIVGPLPDARVAFPSGVTYIDSTKTLYYMDSSGVVNEVKDDVVSFRAGIGGGIGEGGLDISPSGNVFLVVGKDRHAVFQVNSSQTFSVEAGSAGTSGTTNSTFANSRFNAPQDVEIISATSSTNWQALVADTGNGLVRRLVRSGGLDSNTSVTTEISSLNAPTGIAVRGAEIYVAESGAFRIRVQKGGDGTSIGSGINGFLDGPGNVAQFGQVDKLEWIGDALYVTDKTNNRIRQLTLRPGASPLNPAAWHVATISGTGVTGSTDGIGIMTHNNPTGITAGHNQELFVADRSGHRIRRILPVESTFPIGVGLGIAPPSSDLPNLSNADGFAPSQPVETPYQVENAIVAAGGTDTLKSWEFVVPEGVSAFEFVVTVESTPSSAASLPSVSNPGFAVGNGSPNVQVRGFSGGLGGAYADGTVSGAGYNQPGDICFDSEGNAFVADTNNNAIRRIDIDGTVTTIAGRPGTGTTLDGLSTIAVVVSPQGVACNPEGTEVFFTQGDHCVRRASFFLRDDITDSTDNDIKLRESWRVDTIAGAPGTSGTVDNANGATARFNQPFGIVFASATTVFVSEQGSHRLRSIVKTGPTNLSSSYTVTTLAGGTASGFADSVTPASVRFNKPGRMGLTPSGLLYVADTLNHRIRKVTPGGATTTLAGSGSATYRDSAFGAPCFNNPNDVTVDAAGYAYVADTTNRVVRRISPGGTVSTVAGGGSVGVNDGTGDLARFTSLTGIGSRPTGEVYVIDGSRIRLIQRIIQQ